MADRSNWSFFNAIHRPEHTENDAEPNNSDTDGRDVRLIYNAAYTKYGVVGDKRAVLPCVHDI
jgi:hypothetical protein